MKAVIFIVFSVLAIVLSGNAKAVRKYSKSNGAGNDVEAFAQLPKDIQMKVLKKFNELRENEQLQDVMLHGPSQPQRASPQMQMSPYQARQQAFYGGGINNHGGMHQHQQPMMMAGPDPFYAMRDLQMDTSKLDKIMDKMSAEAAEKKEAQTKEEEGGGDGMGQILNLAIKFAPMLISLVGG